MMAIKINQIAKNDCKKALQFCSTFLFIFLATDATEKHPEKVKYRTVTDFYQVVFLCLPWLIFKKIFLCCVRHICLTHLLSRVPRQLQTSRRLVKYRFEARTPRTTHATEKQPEKVKYKPVTDFYQAVFLCIPWLIFKVNYS
jgi:hypothetical protein